MKARVLLTLPASLLMLTCTTAKNSFEPVATSASALDEDLGGARSDAPIIIDSDVGVIGGGGGPPGGLAGFCYFTQIVGAFIKNSDYVKIEPHLSQPRGGYVWSYQASGGVDSPFATVHCITFDQFSGAGFDPNSYATHAVGPATAVQTGPATVTAGALPLWPQEPPPPPPEQSDFDTLGWIYGHVTTDRSGAWISYGVPFVDPSSQYTHGECYVDEDPGEASGCGVGPCTLTSKFWAAEGNVRIELSHALSYFGTFAGLHLGSVSDSVCFINGIAGDWSSPTTFASVTNVAGEWVGNGADGGGVGEHVSFMCYRRVMI